jgi:hypothetical protein
LPLDLPVQLGRTETHVVVRVGPWTIWNEIQKEAHFPRVEESIPDPSAVTTRLRLDPEDASFLAAALDRLAGKEETFSPATLDMNGKVAIRARGSEQPLATELILGRSRYSGPAVRFNTDRAYLGRAIRMGFRDFDIAGAGLPIVCRHDHLLYAWQPLSSESAIEPTDNVVRIQSSPEAPDLGAQETRQPAPRRIMKDCSETNGHVHRVAAGSNEQTASESPGTKLATLINDAEALHVTLSEAKSSLARLVSGLRRQRKQARLVGETLRSLKQLKLTEVTE